MCVGRNRPFHFLVQVDLLDSGSLALCRHSAARSQRLPLHCVLQQLHLNGVGLVLGEHVIHVILVNARFLVVSHLLHLGRLSGVHLLDSLLVVLDRFLQSLQRLQQLVPHLALASLLKRGDSALQNLPRLVHANCALVLGVADEHLAVLGQLEQSLVQFLHLLPIAEIHLMIDVLLPHQLRRVQCLLVDGHLEDRRGARVLLQVLLELRVLHPHLASRWEALQELLVQRTATVQVHQAELKVDVVVEDGGLRAHADGLTEDLLLRAKHKKHLARLVQVVVADLELRVQNPNLRVTKVGTILPFRR